MGSQHDSVGFIKEKKKVDFEIFDMAVFCYVLHISMKTKQDYKLLILMHGCIVVGQT